MPEKEIFTKLREHDKKFIEHDKRFDEHDKRFDQIDRKLTEHDQQFEIVVAKLLEHDDRLDRLESKVDEMVTKNEFNTRMDEMLVILKRLDEERVVTSERLVKLEDMVFK